MPKLKSKSEFKADPSAFALLPPEDGDPTSWTFTIPGWLPTRLNLLLNSHHLAANRMKRKDAETIRVACFMAGMRAAIWADGDRTVRVKRRLTCTIILGPKMRGGDPDAFNKSLRDGLKHCRAIADDNRQWLAGSDAEYERGPVMGTRITLEDID